MNRFLFICKNEKKERTRERKTYKKDRRTERKKEPILLKVLLKTTQILKSGQLLTEKNKSQKVQRKRKRPKSKKGRLLFPKSRWKPVNIVTFYRKQKLIDFFPYFVCYYFYLG
jgi:hypothetical protein